MSAGKDTGAGFIDAPAPEDYEFSTPTGFLRSVEIERKVLDHGLVRLVDSMGSDLSVSRAARVSFDAPARPEDEKLINYLWKNHHTTPFESVTFTFEVMAPIFVFRQWHRHRTQSYNELSARYRELPETYYLPKPDKVGVQSTNNKQGKETGDHLPSILLVDRQTQIDKIDAHCKAAFALYRDLLQDGWPRELARMVLPLNTYSHMFVTMNLLNLLKFLTLRVDPHAQEEIRVYAEAMVELARGVVPVCIDAWEKTQNHGTNKV